METPPRLKSGMQFMPPRDWFKEYRIWCAERGYEWTSPIAQALYSQEQAHG